MKLKSLFLFLLLLITFSFVVQLSLATATAAAVQGSACYNPCLSTYRRCQRSGRRGCRQRFERCWRSCNRAVGSNNPIPR